MRTNELNRSRELVVDDEPAMLQFCSDSLRGLAKTVVAVEEKAERTANLLEAEIIDLLITDIRLPGMNGLQLAKLGREKNPGMAIIIMTGFPEVETAVRGLKLGAADYLVKPFDPDNLLAVAKRQLRSGLEPEEMGRRTSGALQPDNFHGLLGQSEVMQP
jgi:DNA-binding NtrC family response regulator